MTSAGFRDTNPAARKDNEETFVFQNQLGLQGGMDLD